jgi:hypothetical protein
MISTEDYLYYVDVALGGMVGIVVGLGDELANRRPEVPGVNAPYAILTHCVGVMEYWGGQVIAGRAITRDRDAEFVACGEVAELVARVRVARERLERDLAGLDPYAVPRGEVSARDAETPMARTQGGAALHIYEELAQHHGQMELTRDLLRAG